MNEFVVLADGAAPNINFSPTSEILKLLSYGKEANIRCQIDAFRLGLMKDIPDIVDDLLRVAAIVYSADTRIKRGTDKDVFGENWARNLNLYIPVRLPDKWNDFTINNHLSKTLNFLTGDKWNLSFTLLTEREPTQKFLFKESITPLPKVKTIIPFSGGVDSLAAVIEAVRNNLSPLLVSHRSSPVIDHRQINLVTLLRQNFNKWNFPHISMWVNRKGGPRSSERTQRSRAFLFSSLAAAAAYMLNVDEIRLCDNGVMSVNLPQSGQTIGTYASRSTHPKYLQYGEIFFNLLLGMKSLSVKNTLIFKTRKEVMQLIHNSKLPQLIQETVSCTRIEGMTSMQPHCGVCSQCIDRRFASIGADLEDYDLPEKYEKDVFCESLAEGNERTYAENYVRFAINLKKILSPDELFNRYPELIDCLPDESGDMNAFGLAIFDLLNRHQKNTNYVIEEKIKNHVQDILSGNLPRNSLICITVEGKHLLDLRVKYVSRLRELLVSSLPPAFQTEMAKNERHVQDVGEGLLIAAKETLYREAPQIPFGTISTKPDFSNSENNTFLFIEFKFCKDRKRLNSITTEITSRITIYRDQGAWTLFLVYDPNRAIVDDYKFSNAIEKHEGVYIGISR